MLSSSRGILRERPALQGIAWAALPTLLLLVLAATAMGYNTPYPTVVAADSEMRQVLFDFHGLEQSADDGPFRWTDGSSQICLDQLGRMPSSLLVLRVLGAGANALGNNQIDLQVDGRPLATLPIIGVTRKYYVSLSDTLSQRDQPCLTLGSRAVTSSYDSRALGVPFASLAISPLHGAAPIRPATLMLGLNLVLAALGYGALRRLGVTPWWATLALAAVVASLTAAVVGGAISPGLGLVRHMQLLVAGGLTVALGLVLNRALRVRLPTATMLQVDLLGMAFWSLALVGLVHFFQRLLGYSSVWPLKAGFYPQITPLIVLAVLAFSAWAWLILRAIDPGRPEPRLGVALALLLVGAPALAVLLKATTRGWGTLFSTFDHNPYEYIADVARVGDDPLGFLRTFVAIKDQLALHSSTHPPGSILLLWAVDRLLGPGTVPATFVAIGLSSLIALVGLWLGWRLGGARAGILAGAIAAVMPGQLIYSVTSMDGVFSLLLALGVVAFLFALEPPFRARTAALAGLLIGVGLFFTYAATQLAFFGLGVAAVSVVRRWGAARGSGAARLWVAARPALRQSLIAAAVIVGIYLLTFLTSGFNVVEGALRATAINANVMRSVHAQPFIPPSLAYYTLYIGANLLAFAWYVGPWGLTASLSAGGAALRARPLSAWASLAAGLAALIAGMTLSGLFNREVERIWAFAYPLLATLVASHALQGTNRERRWRAGLFLCLAFAQGLCFRVLLNP